MAFVPVRGACTGTKARIVQKSKTIIKQMEVDRFYVVQGRSGRGTTERAEGCFARLYYIIIRKRRRLGADLHALRPEASAD